MKEQLFYFLGLGFSLSAFALKVALVLPFLKHRFSRLFILGVYALFFIFGYILAGILEKYLFVFLERGVYLHILLALGLLFWGLNLLFKPSCSHKALFLYLLPCPVCLTSLLIATLYYKKLFPSSPLGPLSPFLPLLIFLTLTMFFYFLFPRILKISPETQPKEVLRRIGLFMFFSGLYILGSFYFPERLQKETSSLNQGLSPFSSTNLRASFEALVIALFLAFSFLFGFLKSKRVGG